MNPDANSPVRTALDRALVQELEALEARSLRRRLPAPRAEGAVDLVSNDYLGLARDGRVVEAAREALAAEGAGGRAARLLGGGGVAGPKLEELAAGWLGAERALLLPSGTQANQALIGALAGRGDVLISDELNHASLIDAMRLGRATVRIAAHNDLASFESQLLAARGFRRRFVVVESIYSMDGDAAPLVELARLCEEHDAWMIVDEAHAAGLVGPAGAGLWAAARREGAPDRVVARMVTGGKALGANGALVAGSAPVVDSVLQKGRAFVFTTAPAPATAAALSASIGIVRKEETLRTRPRDLARRAAEALGLPAPAAAILPVVLGQEERALAAASALTDAGFDVRAVRPPTVPEGTARLRLTFHAGLAEDDVDRACALIRPWLSDPAAETDAAPARTAQVIVVSGTDTDAGKTVAAAVLVRGLGARYWKPVQTGDDCDTATVHRLAGLDEADWLEPAARFALPASPHEAAAAEGGRVPLEELAPRLGELRSGGDRPLVVELAGGLEVPLTDDVTQLDHLAQNPLPLVLVARSGLGTLNHTLLSLAAARARGLEVRALLLVGPPHPSNRATLERLGRVPVVLELPRLDPLDTASIDAWLLRNDLSGILPVD